MLLGIDRSHHNTDPDYLALRAGGLVFVLAKATDGVGFTDPDFATARAGAEAAGLVFGGYHFAEWGDPVAEARYFLSVAAPRPGELIALDAEAAPPAGVDVVAWCQTWSQTVHAATGGWPLLYMNQSWLAGHDWTPLAGEDGLWLAKYDGQPTGGATGPWAALAMKQFTDTGTVTGQPGQIDEDAFEADLPTLLKYTVPTTGGILMALTDAQQTQLFNDVELIKSQLIGPWPSFRFGDKGQTSLTAVDYLRSIDRQVNSPLDLTGRPGPASDNEWGHLLTVRAELEALAAKVGQPQPAIIDQAAADRIAASLIANPDFQKVVAAAAAATVSQIDADLAKRFGPTAP